MVKLSVLKPEIAKTTEPKQSTPAHHRSGFQRATVRAAPQTVQDSSSVRAAALGIEIV